MSPHELRRLNAHLAKSGESYSGPRKEPTRDDLFRRQPQLCRECGNGWAGRILLSPDQGLFFTDHNGTRWVCHRCIKLFKMPNTPSPGEVRLADQLIEANIKFIPQ